MTTTISKVTILVDGDPCQVAFYNGDPTDVMLPDLDDTLWRENATDCYSNGQSDIYRYDLGNDLALSIDVDCGEIMSLEVSTTSIEDLLAQWDHPGRLSEWLSEWDLDGLMAEQVVDETYDGECLVWRAPQYYHGTYGAPKPGIDRVEDADGQDTNGLLVFADYAAARAYVDDYYNAPSYYDGIPACNVLSHGQAGPDTLTIIAADY